MQEAAGDEELTLVLTTELNGDVLPKCRATLADVDGDVEDAALDDAHELGLCVLSILGMEASDGAVAGAGLVVLDKAVGDACGLVARLVVALKEVASLIGKDAGLKDEQAFNRCVCDVHFVVIIVS